MGPELCIRRAVFCTPPLPPEFFCCRVSAIALQEQISAVGAVWGERAFAVPLTRLVLGAVQHYAIVTGRPTTFTDVSNSPNFDALPLPAVFGFPFHRSNCQSHELTTWLAFSGGDKLRTVCHNLLRSVLASYWFAL